MSDGPLVVFKSVPDFWKREYHGFKPNTVRLLDIMQEGVERIGAVHLALKQGGCATIGIVNTADGRIFYRRLTDITLAGELLGKELVVLSWRHEDGDGTYTEEATE